MEAIDDNFVRSFAASNLKFLEDCKRKNIFPQEDYKELLELAIVWLGGTVEEFTLQTPGPVHHARFMAKAIYYLKMELLANHPFVDNMLTPTEKTEVSSIAQFVGVFYVAWWLKSPLSVSAPHSDLLAVYQMREYRKTHPQIATACLKSLARHGWYLCEKLCILSLFDEDLGDCVRKAVAEALCETPRPKSFTSGKPVFPEVTKQEFWDDVEVGQVEELSI